MMFRSSHLAWLGFILIVIATVLVMSANSILDYILRREFPLQPDAKIYDFWRAPPVPVITKAYFFNCTNTHQLQDKGFKPNFEELGPYTFNEITEKVNITWNSNNTVTYRQVRYWQFDAENSKGKMADQLVTLNPAPVSASYVTRYWSGFAVYPLSFAMRILKTTIWMKSSIQDFFFEGVSDPLLSASNMLMAFSSVKISADKIAIFYKRNGSGMVEGVFNMDTGGGDLSKWGVLHQWNYNNSTVYSSKCGEIRGSAGGLFPPGQQREKPMEIFVGDLCRSVQLDYMEDTVVNGILGYRYVFSKNLIDNGTANPENSCNCDGECLPRGVINASSCRYGAPAFASFPHFLGADPHYTIQVNGMMPDPDRHLCYIIVEPTTGIPLDITLRMQVNLLLKSNPNFRLFQDVPTLMFPIMWLEERAVLPPLYSFLLKLLILLPTLFYYFSLAFLVLGLSIIVYIAMLYCNKRRPLQEHLMMDSRSEDSKKHRKISVDQNRESVSEIRGFLELHNTHYFT